MKNYHLIFTVLIITLLFMSLCPAQKADVDHVAVPLSDPARPAFLKVGLISGSITIKGTSGKEVIVDAQIKRQDDEEKEERSEKTRGLRLIPNTSTGLTVEEEDNVVRVNIGAIGGSRTIDLTIQVPTSTSIKASTINDGDIEISDVKGDMEVSNTNGSITMNRISGSVVADAINNPIKVTFTSVDPAKSMSFSSLNGDLDITFPSTIKANLSMKDEQGEIFSDFDIKMTNSSVKSEDSSEKHKGKYRVKMEKMMTGAINDGGPEYQFKNFNGDILIRKGK